MPSSRPSESERPEAAQGKTPLPYLIPWPCLGLVLGHADPGDLGVGVGHAGDDLGVEEAVAPRRGFRRDLGFMHRFVGEHRLADDVADREDMRNVGALLLIHRDEAALVDPHTGVLHADQAAVRTAADRDQHAVERVRGGRPAAFERGDQTIGRRLAFQHSARP